MDGNLGRLAKCEHLAISSNNIEKVTGLKALKNLKILSIGRNLIKKFDGIEEVAESLEQLWISYNLIEKMAGIEHLTNIKVLYMSNNLVAKWPEIQRLSALPFLEELLLQGCPIYEDFIKVGTYRIQVVGRVTKLQKLDGAPCFEEERQLGKEFLLGEAMVSRFGNLETVFKKMDENGDGVLDRDEIDHCIRNLGFPFEEHELDAFMKHADANGDGKIQYKEWLYKLSGGKEGGDAKG